MSKAGLSVDHRDHDNPEMESIIARYRRELEDLPEPGDWWQMSEVDSEWIKRRSTFLQSAEIITVVENRIHEPSNKYLNVYKTTEEAWDWLEYHRRKAKQNRILPCSDSDCPGCSFENPRDVDGIVCKDCNEVHDPDEI